MADPAKRKATYQDVLDADPHVHAEIVNGELRLSPRPKGGHGVAHSGLAYLLGPPFHFGQGGPGGWVIIVEPEVHLGEQVLVPDIAGWRIERMPLVEDVAYFTLAPDWACEVLSRSTAKMDRSEKLPIYAAAGVRHAWLLDAKQRTLEVMRLHEGKWLIVAVHHDDACMRAEPFDAIELDLALLWAKIALPPRGTHASEAALEYEP